MDRRSRPHLRRRANRSQAIETAGHRYLAISAQTANPRPAGVVSFEQAYEAVQRCWQKLKAPEEESVSIADSLGRVLAQPLLADRDFPPFPRATRDGYAVRASDIRNAATTLRVAGQIKAGGKYDKTVEPGQAVEIMTGAAIPQGADAVVMVEYTQRKDERVEILRAVKAGENIVLQGSEAKAGQVLLPPGTPMDFAQIAVAAAVGKTNLRVYKKPRAAILATGDELVDLDAKPGPYQIRNSNSYSLASQVMLAGGEPVRYAIAADDKAALTARIKEGLSSDLMLLSGGVSMGQFDLVEHVLRDLGAEFFFTGVQIQPGRPVVFGQAPSGRSKVPTPFFGLPGNPISTMVTFDLFARPVLRALSGSVPVRLPTAKARLAKEIKTKTGLTRFLPAILSGGLYDPEVALVPWQGSGDISASARANCYVIVPPDRELIAVGEMISVLLRSSS